MERGRWRGGCGEREVGKCRCGEGEMERRMCREGGGEVEMWRRMWRDGGGEGEVGGVGEMENVEKGRWYREVDMWREGSGEEDVVRGRWIVDKREVERRR